MDTDPKAALEEQRVSLLTEYQDRVTLARRLRLAIANEDDPVQQRYYQDLLATQESILQDLRQEAAELGITQEQLDGADQQAVADANADPIESEQLGFYESSGLNVLVNGAAGIGIGVGHGAAINFNNFTLGLTPWADDIHELIDENGYGVADGFSKGGVVALAAAGGLAAWPAIAEFAGSSFVLPAFRFGGGGLAFAGGGSTGGAVLIGGGVVSGTQVVSAAGLASITALCMGEFREVDIRKLQNPNSQPFADPIKLRDQRAFDLEKYTPALVELKKNGVLKILNGVTRIENALRNGVTRLIVEIFKG